MGIKRLFAPRDMTEGIAWKRILEMFFPMLIANLSQQIYSLTDSIVVGKYVGDTAIAAVSNAIPIINMINIIFSGIATGATIIISQERGAKKHDELSRSIGNCISLIVILSAVIMAIGPFLMRPVLGVINTPASIFDSCLTYLNIYCVCIIGAFSFALLSGVLRSLGDSFTALVAVVVAAVVNIALDILFVAGFNMGVSGVAIATALAQGISALLCLLKLMSMKDIFSLDKKSFKIDIIKIGKFLSIGIPSSISMVFFTTASMLVQTLVNNMGEMVVALNAIILRVESVALLPFQTLGGAITIYVAQNLGAEKYKRIVDGIKSGGVILLCFLVLTSLSLIAFSRPLFGVFTDTPEIIDLAVRIIRILVVGYAFCSVICYVGGIVLGMGKTKLIMLMNLSFTFLLQVPFAYAIAHLSKSAMYPNGSPFSVYIANTVAWGVNATIYLIIYFCSIRKKWNEKREEVHL